MGVTLVEPQPVSVAGQGERWLPIPGFEGRYEVSSEGRVRSLRKSDGQSSIPRQEPLVLRSQKNGPKGYQQVRMRGVPGQKEFWLVHRLVLGAFVGPCPPGHQGSHLNGDPTDNRLANLIWEPTPANNGRKREHGTTNAGERSPQAVLTEAVAIEIRHRYAAGETAPVLAAEFGTSRNTIYHLVNGLSWRHVGGPVTHRNRRHLR